MRVSPGYTQTFSGSPTLTFTYTVPDIVSVPEPPDYIAFSLALLPLFLSRRKARMPKAE
jgi:hypothetical protein